MGKGGMIEYDSSQWVRMLFKLEGSVLNWNTVPQILITGAMAFVAMYAQELHVSAYGAKYHVPDIGHKLVGVSLGFLLVFRSNLSYGRYWEGRGHLGFVIKVLRDICRQASVYIDDDEGDEEKKEIARLCRIFMALMVCHLRGIDKLTPDEQKTELESVTREYLPDDLQQLDLHALATSQQAMKRKPLFITALISRVLKKAKNDGKMSKREYANIDHNVGELIAGFNGCDKVYSVPLPFPYAQLLVILLCIYCFTVPFVFIQYFEKYYSLVPLCMMVAFALFGINAVGLEIEDPFGEDANDLPLPKMRQALISDTKMMLEQAKFAKHMHNDTYKAQ